jgi:GNAT superfamily N-acetyltransferase
MLTIRPATVADAAEISAVHCSDIVAWKWWDAAGEAHWADYAALTPAQRWQNGGPWMDATTCSLHLERWMAREGLALVAEADGQIVAEAEVVLGEEPPPFGRHLNLSVIYTLRGHAGRGLGSALMDAIHARARATHCATLVVSYADAAQFYAKHGFALHQTWRRAKLTAQFGNTQYTATRFDDADYDTVRGWAMPVGRYQSARQEWERMRPGAEPAFTEWANLRLERWFLTVRQKPAVLVLDESPRSPGTADVHVWLPPGQTLTRQHLAAIRDRAAHSGFRELLWFVAESTLPALGAPWETDGYKQQVWVKFL